MPNKDRTSLATPFSLLLAAIFALLAFTPLRGASTGSVVLAWDPNPEPNIATYIVQYGTSSGNYSHAVEVGNVTTATLSDLAPSTYYAVVTARDTNGLESLPSDEISFAISIPPPPVSWVGLADGAFLNGPRPILLESSTASHIARVEFYAGSSKVGEASASSPIAVWNNDRPGDHTLEVRGFDESGQLVHTEAITIHIIRPETRDIHRRPDGAFEFQLIGAPGRVQHVYASTNLQDWTLLESILNETGTIIFTDLEAANIKQRFYRVASE
jgi:hypothetical protein